MAGETPAPLSLAGGTPAPRALDVQNLSTEIKLTRSVVQAVGDVDIAIDAGETLGLVGESGCGKSMLGLSILGLLPPGGEIVGGSVKLEGRELVGLRDRELQKLRGNTVSMIFQDSQSSLNPTKTIGEQVAEPVRLHRDVTKREAGERALEVLELVGLPQPRERLGDYPHQLSGGLRQRVMIAIALACEPSVLIADEPTTALDVTIQAQILRLLDDLEHRLGMATLLVTHDMGVVAGRSNRISVMYAGRIVETASTDAIFNEMRHPYTQALLGSIPKLSSDNTKPLVSIRGIPPDLTAPPLGCRFAARCPYVTDQCRSEEPPLAGDPGHLFRCWHPVDGPVKLEDLGSISVTNGGGSAARAVADLLKITNVVREYPVTAGAVLQRKVNSVKAVSDITLAVGVGRDARAGRRVGVRQDDARQADRRGREAGRRLDHARRERDLTAARPRAAPRAA